MQAGWEKSVLQCIVLIGVIASAIGLWFCIRTLRVRSYSDAPNITGLKDHYIGKEESETKRQLVANLEESITQNKKILLEKAEHLSKVSKYALTVLLVLIILSVLVNLAYNF